MVFGDRVKFGDGRAELLELVDRLGSFNQAVARFGMSYRGAWGYFRELERASGLRLLARRPGAGPRGGTRLTEEGREFLRRWRRFRTGLDGLVAHRFARAFGRAPRAGGPRPRRDD
ncbi:MAG TPA: LysR family transcriptional regulator [Calidithermus sp.]|nr:LysR family transcriptional regulator [Calidithermus sp.]